MRRSSLLLRAMVFGGFGVLVLGVTPACGGGGSGPEAGPEADGGRLEAPYHVPGRPCDVVIESPPLLASPHVPEGTAITYNSSPPSSGPHYPVWANFQEFNTSFDDGYLVHSLEHGAVAMLHQALPLSPDQLEALRKVRESLPTDFTCDASIRVRAIIAPYPKMDVPFAATAWGWTYRAKCLDVPTLTQFLKEHYNHGTEDFCVPGRTF